MMLSAVTVLVVMVIMTGEGNDAKRSSGISEVMVIITGKVIVEV